MKPAAHTPRTNIKRKSWLAAIRPPFYSVGIIPFLLGSVLAAAHGYEIETSVLLLALTAVFLIMLSTYLLGEYYDFESDRINKDFNRFSGGSRVFVHEERPYKVILLISYTAAFWAAAIGAVLHFYYQVGIYTLPLGITGLFLGIFYSSKPLQLAYRGIGEIAIGFCYGWLAVNSAYYLVSSTFHPAGTLISLPVGFSIFAVILINEFPDYYADKAAGKNNLVVKLGISKASHIYSVLTIMAMLFLLFNLRLEEIPLYTSWYFLLPLALGLVNLMAVNKKLYRDENFLEKICGATIIFNLLLSSSYILSLLNNMY